MFFFRLRLALLTDGDDVAGEITLICFSYFVAFNTTMIALSLALLGMLLRRILVLASLGILLKDVGREEERKRKR